MGRPRQALDDVPAILELLVAQNGDECAHRGEVRLETRGGEVHEPAVGRLAVQRQLAHPAVARLKEDEGGVLTRQQRVAGEHECRPLDGQAVGVERGGGGIGRAQDSERVDVAGGGAHKVRA